MVAAQRQSDVSLRRAAILLNHLDAENRRRLLAHFPAAEATRLRAAAASLADVDPLEVHRVVTAFVGRVATARQQSAGEEAKESAPATPAAADDSSDQPSGPAGLRFLHRVSDETLLKAVAHEHPQTVAVVLASIQPQQAARLLKRLAPEVRRDAIRRLGRLQEIPQDVIDDIGRHLQEIVGQLEPLEAGQGRRTLTNILAELDGTERVALLGGLGESEGIVASALREVEQRSPAPPASNPASQQGATSPIPPQSQPHVVRLHRSGDAEPEPAHGQLDLLDEDSSDMDVARSDAILESLKPRELQRVLADLPARCALLTLCGLSPRTVKRVIRTLPRRQAREVRERLDRIGSLELREIEAAKRMAARRAVGAPSEHDRFERRVAA